MQCTEVAVSFGVMKAPNSPAGWMTSYALIFGKCVFSCSLQRPQVPLLPQGRPTKLFPTAEEEDLPKLSANTMVKVAVCWLEGSSEPRGPAWELTGGSSLLIFPVLGVKSRTSNDLSKHELPLNTPHNKS